MVLATSSGSMEAPAADQKTVLIHAGEMLPGVQVS
jgi:hypothetical protein